VYKELIKGGERVDSVSKTDFWNLTWVGRMRRLGRLAEVAIKEFDLEVRDMRVHSFATNLLYRIRSRSGTRYILRMAYPGWRTFEDLRAEAAWLDALHRETDIGAPQVIRSRKGDVILPMSGFGVSGTWYATLMTWIDGRLLAHALTPENLERMGELFAKLHRHGKAWLPPKDFTTKRFEAFLSRGEPDILFSNGTLQSFAAEDKQAFLTAREWVEKEYSHLPRNDLRVIHCDLWHENIKVDHGKLRPFDFEDTIWGYRLHDIAMGMLDLLETVGNARYQELLLSFRSGYEKLLEWPEGNLEVLQIGRLLWKVNWTARFSKDDLAGMSIAYGGIFRNFERTGELRWPEPLKQP
ncbi:MAG TPA: phosphotransferase, partial [Thermotogota bacterium]|nr:phosphotransferase [Thermotogota bacterium]